MPAFGAAQTLATRSVGAGSELLLLLHLVGALRQGDQVLQRLAGLAGLGQRRRCVVALAEPVIGRHRLVALPLRAGERLRAAVC